VDLKYLDDIELGFLIEVITEINKMNNQEVEAEEDTIIADKNDYKQFGF
jgi:hypothetical protein